MSASRPARAPSARRNVARRIDFVMVEPRAAGNVGAAARAIKNCGFHSLRLVRPPPLDGEAEKMAWKSLDVLRAARIFPTLDAAIAGARLVAGFSVRARRDTREVLALDAAAPRILAAERHGRVALLFGREDRGLTTAELAACSFLVRIPAARARQVYNVSQAMLLAAFQLGHLESQAPAARAPQNVPPTAAERAHLLGRIRAALLALGYAGHPDQGLLERIVTRAARLLDRAGTDAPDRAMLLGVLRRVQRLARLNGDDSP